MSMMKTKKYRKKHYVSKSESPTVGGKSGEAGARSIVYRRIGRPLAGDTVTRHTRSQWVFCEPKKIYVPPLAIVEEAEVSDAVRNAATKWAERPTV